MSASRCRLAGDRVSSSVKTHSRYRGRQGRACGPALESVSVRSQSADPLIKNNLVNTLSQQHAIHILPAHEAKTRFHTMDWIDDLADGTMIRTHMRPQRQRVANGVKQAPLSALMRPCGGARPGTDGVCGHIRSTQTAVPTISSVRTLGASGPERATTGATASLANAEHGAPSILICP